MADLETTPQTTAGAALFRRLHALGVDWVFCNSGTDFPPIIEGLAVARATGAPVPDAVVVPHEHAAMGLAHGVWLATGRPQAVMLHTNVGLANGVIGAINAWADQVPILLLSGRTPAVEAGRFGARAVPIAWGQEMRDQTALVRETTKWDYELRFPEQLLEILDRALAVAMSTPAGPVYLSLPREVLCAPCPTGGLDDPPRMAAAETAPTTDALARVAEVIATAERPLIIAQRGAGSAAGLAMLADLSERWALPVSQWWATRLALPSAHPMNLGSAQQPWLSKADVVVVLDSLAPWAPDRDAPPHEAHVLHLAPDPLFQRTPVRNFRADITVSGSTERILSGLITHLEPLRDTATPRIEQRRERLLPAIAETRAAHQVRPDTGGPLTKAQVAAVVSDAVGHLDPVVFSELGCPLDQLELECHDSWFQEPHAGGLGWSFPAAIGFKLGQPHRLVVATMGDGSYIFANPVACHQLAQALQTPLLVLILNNGGWGAVRQSVLDLYPDGAAARTNTMPLTAPRPAPDYAAIARAAGALAQTVGDAASLKHALSAALDHLERHHSMALLDIAVV